MLFMGRTKTALDVPPPPPPPGSDALLATGAPAAGPAPGLVAEAALHATASIRKIWSARIGRSFFAKKLQHVLGGKKNKIK